MIQKKTDGVIEAVRYVADGNIKLVFLYESRDEVFSDHVLLNREDLLRLLKSRRKLVTRKHVEFMAETFQTKQPVITQEVSGKEIILIQDSHSSHDWLEGVLLF